MPAACVQVMPHTSCHVEHGVTSVCEQPDTAMSPCQPGQLSCMPCAGLISELAQPWRTCVQAAHMQLSSMWPKSGSPSHPTTGTLSKQTGIRIFPFSLPRRERVLSISFREMADSIPAHRMSLFHELISLQYKCRYSHTQGAAASQV